MSTYTYTPSLYQFPSLLKALAQTSGPSPSLDLRFALDKSLTAYRGPTPSFSRASTGSYFDGSGVLRYANVNVLLYSEQFENAYWDKTGNVTITSNQVTAPDGKLTADLLKPTASNTTHYLYRSSLTYSAGNNTLSLFVKYQNHRWVIMQYYDGGPQSKEASFDLLNGVSGAVSPGASSSIINVGNGWYRISITSSNASSSSTAFFTVALNQSDSASIQSWSATGTESVAIWGAQLETGSTVGTYCPTTSSANSAPRFNHTFNGTSWVSKGLLVEEQRTNLLINSNTFSSSWTLVRGTIAQDQTGPDGTTSGWTATCNSTGAGHYVYITPSSGASASGAYTISIFAKKGNNGLIALQIADTSSSNYVLGFFDLTNGVANTAYQVVGSYSATSSRIENIGNGWYRCSLTSTKGSSNVITAACYASNNDTTGFCTSGQYNYLYNAQLEFGAFATSTIVTTSAQVTRSADVCQITGSDFSGFWNGTEGSIAAEYDLYSPSVGSAQGESFLWQVDDGTNNNRILVTGTSGSTASNKNRYAVITTAGTQALLDNQVVPANVSVYSSAAWKLNDAAFYSGSNGLFDTSVAIPAGQSNLRIGQRTGDYYLNGHIARLRYFNKRLPNATLQLLSEPDPTLNLQFALNKTLTPVAGPAPSFSRASTGSYFDSTGTLKYANVNLITYSEQFDNAAWSERVGNTLYTNVAASPIGDMTADQLQLTSSGFYYQKKAYSTTGTHTFSVWLRSSSPTTTLLRLSNDAGTENSVATCNVTTSWQRFSVTRNWSANPVNFYAGLDQRTVVGGPGTSTDVFIWGAQLELASSPSQYAKTEASTTAGPRFDHVYSGGQWVSRGLLVEEQRTNGLLQSNGYGNSPWTIASSRGTVTQNAASPDGTNNAWTGNCTVTAPGGFYLIQGGLSSPSATYTLSFFAKKDNNGFVAIEAGETSNDVYVFFDLTNGLSGNLSSVGGYTNISHGLSDCGNGWYRCRLTFTKSNSNNLTAYIYPTCNSFSSLSCTSGQTNFIFGAQYETGSFATSYIGTTSSSVTRSADVCQITGTSFNWMWNQGEGSVAFEADTFSSSSDLCRYFEFTMLSSVGSPAIGTATVNSAGSAGGDNVYNFVWDSSFQAQLYASPARPSAKNAFAWKANDFAASINGATALTDASGTIPSGINVLTIASRYGSLNLLNGHIAKLVYYPARLTNTKLQQLST